MNPYAKIIGAIAPAAKRARTWIEKVTKNPQDRIPTDKPEDRPDLANFVKALYEDSERWRSQSFHGRRRIDNPMEFWRKARLIESGLHWDVWGRRNTAAGQAWKQEFTDDETENQVRMRKAYLGGAWHDVTISPNVKDITAIVDYERGKTGWTDMIFSSIHTGMVEGTVHLHETLDKSEDARGVSKTILLENSACFPTPFATGLSKLEGSWYFLLASMKTKQQALETYRDLDPDEFVTSKDDFAHKVSLNSSTTFLSDLTHTQLVDELAVWFDDPALEKIPVSDEEIAAEHQAISAGEEGAEVKDDQNHIEHIRKHLEWLENSVNGAFVMADETLGGEPNPEFPPEIAQAITEYTLQHLIDHMEAQRLNADLRIPAGYRPKYPNGRKVVVVGGVVAEDTNMAEQFGMDWRRLFRKIEVEKLPGHYWGRGLVEVMWETNKVLDTMLSRTGDSAITTSLPKPWFRITDKKTLTETPYNNDPTEPGFYADQAPTFPQGREAPENFKLYQAKKENAAKAFGVSDVSYGQAPGASSSGKLVDILLQQMQIIVTGEANVRWNAAIEDIIETKMMMYRKFYTEPRWFFINGRPQAITLADALKTFKIQGENGQEEEKEIPGFEIRVAPNSNFPKAWEMSLAFMLELSQHPTEDGVPLVPRKAIAEMLAERYPKLAPGGEYYREAEATAIGMQVMAQQQAQEQMRQQREVQTLDMVAKKFIKKGADEITKSEPNTGAVNGQEPEAAGAA